MKLTGFKHGHDNAFVLYQSRFTTNHQQINFVVFNSRANLDTIIGTHYSVEFILLCSY